MRREPGGRALYRSRAARRRRSLLLVVLLVMAALVAVLVARGGHAAVTVTYDRAAAVRYADTWALSRNPAYWSSQTDDCANFVSQCVAAGGLRRWAARTGVARRRHGVSRPAWVNCGRQQSLWSAAAAGHTPYIVQHSAHLPATGAAATWCTWVSSRTASRSGSTSSSAPAGCTGAGSTTATPPRTAT